MSKTTEDPELDSMLDDALREYEKLEHRITGTSQQVSTVSDVPTSTSSSTTSTTTTTTTTTATGEGGKLFPVSEEDVEATLRAVMEQLSTMETRVSAAAAVPATGTTTMTTTTTTTTEQQDEDPEATAAVEKYLAKIAEEATKGTGEGETTGTTTTSAAVVELLKPFVSREMLYPPLAELRSRFPAWLERNKETLPATEHAQRVEQFECLKRVCELYERQKGPDDHVQEIVVLIERMGQAPKELVEEATASAAAANGGTDGGDGSSAGAGGGLPKECSLM